MSSKPPKRRLPFSEEEFHFLLWRGLAFHQTDMEISQMVKDITSQKYASKQVGIQLSHESVSYFGDEVLEVILDPEVPIESVHVLFK